MSDKPYIRVSQKEIIVTNSQNPREFTISVISNNRQVVEGCKCATMHMSVT
jgi:hypothetical protein